LILFVRIIKTPENKEFIYNFIFSVEGTHYKIETKSIEHLTPITIYSSIFVILQSIENNFIV